MNWISIHALREEGDLFQIALVLFAGPISIHALREEGDLSASGRGTVPRKFLSTPSARRATATVKDLALELVISIHALREEGDGRHLRRVIVGADISIHALREEGDTTNIDGWEYPRNFYPRPPRGGRQQKQRQNLYFLINYTTFCTNLEEP